MTFKSDLFDLMDNLICVGSYPLFWVVKNKNIIISNGKIGSSTLRNSCDYSCYDNKITSKGLLYMINNQGFRVDFVIREPRSRFRTGILEDWFVSINYDFESYDIEMSDVTNFVLRRLEDTVYSVPRSQYHIGNWLDDVVTLTEYLPKGSYRIWDLSDFTQLLNELTITQTFKYSNSEKPQVCNRFLELYDNLPNSVTEKVEEYLEEEVIKYHYLSTLK